MNYQDKTFKDLTTNGNIQNFVNDIKKIFEENKIDTSKISDAEFEEIEENTVPETLNIPLKDLQERIFLGTGNNKYVFEDEEYMKEYYPVEYTLQQLIKTYGV